MRQLPVILVGVLAVGAAAPAAEQIARWSYDARRCMAFNSAPEGTPSVLMEVHGDRLILRAVKEGDMEVSAKETMAMIAKLTKCDAEAERYWNEWRKKHPGKEP